jgi:hypothetical protein
MYAISYDCIKTRLQTYADWLSVCFLYCSFSAATSFLLTHHWKNVSVIQEMTTHTIRMAKFLPTIVNNHQPEETTIMKSTYIYSSFQIRSFVQIARCYRMARRSRSDIFGAACRLGRYTQQHLLNKDMRIGNGQRGRKIIPIIKSIMKNGM